MFFQCPRCKQRFRGPVKVLPFFCSCGLKQETITYLSGYTQQREVHSVDDLPCQHRGEPLREINCGCSGKPKIYQCKKHGESYLRKLPKMTAEMVQGCTMCLTCDDRSRYTLGRVGACAVVHNRVGGVETYWRIFAETIGLVGIATPQEPKAKSIHYPVFAGDEAIEELAASVDALLVWGITGKDVVTRGPVRIAMHHGSLKSQWANAVFEDELRWCERAVAINEDVAKHYGVEYIPNAVDIAKVENVLRPYQAKKIVAWLHRDAQEKRPHLARRIAEALPDGWIMIASLPTERSTRKLHAIGQVDDVPYWLSVADVFISTADQEGFGLSIAEAMACRVPVVSSPFGLAENAELVEQVDSEEVSEWVAAIERAGPKVDFAESYIRRNHSPAVIAEKWKQILDQWCPGK
jgi:hypothetical protein